MPMHNMFTGSTVEEMLNQLAIACRKFWPGESGQKLAVEKVSFVRQMLTEYSTALGYTECEIFQALERRRDYCCVNYYQRANFPSLDGVLVYDTRDDFLSEIPSRRYRCPACGGVSTDFQVCDSGVVCGGKVCDWKSYGLLRTMGKGLRVAIRDGFLRAPIVHEIFMPLEFERAGADVAIVVIGDPAIEEGEAD